ncbi:NlpC/P60 family protein [uncultured Photobacterium sp.]|uniref:C40 family peptidase n=1 Tax=uncultured Photobacterium sp. TaxID=173973 RepID=UPI002607FAF9|nr:NlpC/P60 family protein [uncultured Photobacterium sp.]
MSRHIKKASVSSHKKKASVSTRKHKVAKSSSINNGMFNRVYRNWKGTPYRYGGSSKKGIDCSAFVQVGYSSVYKKALPRTTLQLVKKGKKVNRNNAKEGDLVFFRTGRNSRHVGIYLGNLKFMHASQSKGVIISRLDNPYWRRHFWQIRRLDKS